MAGKEKKVSAAQRKATDKYLEKFDEMRVRSLMDRTPCLRPMQRLMANL